MADVNLPANVCPVCGRSFPRRCALGSHIRVHRDNAPQPLIECSMCGRMCRGQRGLKAHMKNKHDPDVNRRISQRSRDMWSDSELHDRTLKKIIEKNRSEEGCRRISEGTVMGLSNPDVRRRLSRASKAMWRDPDYREKMADSMDRLHHDPEIRRICNEKMRGHWSDPEYRERLSERISQGIRRKMDVASDDDLSRWLGPHHGDQSDVINKSGSVVHCQSSYERWYCELMLIDDRVIDFDRSGLWLDIIGIGRRYNPDFIVRFDDGHTELVEIKSSFSIRDPLVPFKTEAAIAWCEENDVTFRILKEDQLSEYESLLNGGI